MPLGFSLRSRILNGKGNILYLTACLLWLFTGCTNNPTPAPIEPTAQPTPTEEPGQLATPTAKSTEAPATAEIAIPDSYPFSNLTAELDFPGPAAFHFEYAGQAETFFIQVSSHVEMQFDAFQAFAFGSAGNVKTENPTRWSGYQCGASVYWTVRSDTAEISPVQQAEISCDPDTALPDGFWFAQYRSEIPITVRKGWDTVDGGILLLADSTNELGWELPGNILIKINPDGRPGWQKNLTESGRILTVVEGDDGRIFVVATERETPLTAPDSQPPRQVFYFLELTPDGQEIISRGRTSYGMPAAFINPGETGEAAFLPVNHIQYTFSRDPDAFRKLEWFVPLADGDLILAGSLYGTQIGALGGTHPALSGFWVFRIDSAGQVVWQKVYEMTYPPIFKVVPARDSGIIVHGNLVIESRLHTWVTKIDAEGNTVFWQALEMDAKTVSETPAGGLILVEGNSSGSRVVLLDAQWEVEWVRGYDDVNGDFMFQRDDGTYVFTGHSGQVAFVARLDQDGSIPGCSWVNQIDADARAYLPNQPINVSTQIVIDTHELGVLGGAERLHFIDLPLTVIETCRSFIFSDDAAPDELEIAAPETGQIYPLLFGDEGLLLGAVSNGAWLDAAAASDLLTGTEVYRVYGDKKTFIGQAPGAESVPNGLLSCRLARPLTSESPILLAFSGKWDPFPITEEILDPSSTVYLNAVSEFLADNGLVADGLQLVDIRRIDLNRDGSEEVLVSAVWTDAGGNPKAVTVLRRLSGGELEVIPLAKDLTELPAESIPLLLADLNGDGQIEIVLETRVSGRVHTEAWDFTPDVVLSAVCLEE